MKTVTIIGAGKIGKMTAHFLAHTNEYAVRVVDAHEPSWRAAIEGLPNATGATIDVQNATQLDTVLKGAWAVISCAPFFCNTLIASRAKAGSVHYLDLTEDVAVTKSVMALAKDASTAFIPQCGLAPGYITIAANHLAAPMSEIHELRCRVGALPQFPSNQLKYNMTWSTNGLINEYCNPCEALVDGKITLLPPLENLEAFSIHGTEYEAFNTSGGLGSLAESLAGKARNVNYKTVRYPGHCKLMKFLLHDLGFLDRREELCAIFDRAIPGTYDDVIVTVCVAIGIENGKLVEKTDARRIPARQIDGKHWTGIQITTAAGVCAALDLLRDGKVAPKGFVRMEDIRYEDFIANRFGRMYAV
ncbi:MAG: saccharopine dehydrogenase family protein [Phycisphaerales bacterium]|nr:saccharopine dehydrogenase family protein [Phycisphaerales bacterium]